MESTLTLAELELLASAFADVYTRWPGRLIHVDTTSFDVFDPVCLIELAAQVCQLPTLLESR